MFADAPDVNIGVGTTVQTFKLFNAVQQLLTAFPAHGTPTVYNNNGTSVLGVRVEVIVTHLECEISIVGSQSNIVVAGDLFNFMRFAYYLEGPEYDGTGGSTPTSYLTGVTSGTNITDVMRVLKDTKVPLSVQAYAGAYIVPQTKSIFYRIPVNQKFVFFSANGTYTQWKTDKGNLLLDVVSDSSATPNPTFTHNTRIFFKMR